MGFSSLESEVSTTLLVEGDIPTWLSGTLIRNGPGTFAVGEREVGHWFDGLAMLHAFSFGTGGEKDGKQEESGDSELKYRNRFLETDAYRATQAGEFAGGFATGETTLRDRLKAFVIGEPYDNTNIVAERVGDKYLALTETPRWVEFDPRGLDTLGDVQYEGPKPSGQLSCSHTQRDPWTGELVNFEIEFGRRSAYHIYEMDAPSRRGHVVSIPVEEPGYMHSFALTPRFVVLTEFPLVVDPTRALKPGKQGPFIENFEWKPERGTRFFVIDRDRGEVIAAPRTDAFFGFHHINAYEADSTIGSNRSSQELVIDLETVPDAEALGAASLSDLREGEMEIPGGSVERFRVRIDGRANATIDRTEIYGGATGLPTASPARWCREYQYAYAQGADQPMTDWPRALVKVDIESGEVKGFTDEGNYLGEPIFVPRPDPETSREDDREHRFPVRSGGRELAEDDGVVLSVALDTEAEHSWLLVLDGESFTERARAAIPHAIPFDFHGRYFPELG
ncbi:beta-carotene 15,15'-monooxygenase [Halobacteriales archaeon QS_3_64_16]|nr:MAG: beta-carotene 15,15'-monooxygenase [Halobacteriales archaeon QS_3_64_16]